MTTNSWFPTSVTKSSPKPCKFDQHLDDNYRVETKNLFQELLVTEEETTPDEFWLDIKDSFLRRAIKHVSKKGKRKTTSWLSQKAINLADERRQLKEADLQGSNLYRKLSSEVQLKCRRDKSEYINQLCQELEDQSSHNSTRELFRCVKYLTFKSTARLAITKHESGKVLTESDEIKNRSKNYCENPYASQEEIKDTPEKFPPCGEPDILLSEVRKTSRSWKIIKHRV